MGEIFSFCFPVFSNSAFIHCINSIFSTHTVCTAFRLSAARQQVHSLHICTSYWQLPASIPTCRPRKLCQHAGCTQQGIYRHTRRGFEPGLWLQTSWPERRWCLPGPISHILLTWRTRLCTWPLAPDFLTWRTRCVPGPQLLASWPGGRGLCTWPLAPDLLTWRTRLCTWCLTPDFLTWTTRMCKSPRASSLLIWRTRLCTSIWPLAPGLLTWRRGMCTWPLAPDLRTWRRRMCSCVPGLWLLTSWPEATWTPLSGGSGDIELHTNDGCITSPQEGRAHSLGSNFSGGGAFKT
jgi:hypothetical protein